MFQILINCFGWGEILKHLYIIKSKTLLNMRVKIYFLNSLLYICTIIETVVITFIFMDEYPMV